MCNMAGAERWGYVRPHNPSGGENEAGENVEAIGNVVLVILLPGKHEFAQTPESPDQYHLLSMSRPVLSYRRASSPSLFQT